MIYVMSDIHGEYKKYLAMLEKINFCDDDILYIIGDVVDRGSQPMEILQDMMMRHNVYPILGNHEIMALEVLNALNVEITEQNAESHLTEEMMQAYIDWTFNGGNSTLNGFMQLSKDEKADILDYLNEFTPYDVVDIDNKTYLLVHAGLYNFSEDKKIHEYSITDLTFRRPDYDKQYFSDASIYIVCGHTPTPLISGRAEIYHSHNNICIDCGATFNGGKLACLCLNTMEEFYV